MSGKAVRNRHTPTISTSILRSGMPPSDDDTQMTAAGCSHDLDDMLKRTVDLIHGEVRKSSLEYFFMTSGTSSKVKLQNT